MKYKILADLLRQEIQSKSATQGYRLPTEKALSEKYGMSRQTVRHALQLLTEEGLIRRRQGSGSYATGKMASSSMQVAVIATFLDDYIFPRVLHDVQRALSVKGYSTVVYATENRISTEREILRRLLGSPISGILVEASKAALPNPNLDLYQQLHKAGVPIVFFHSRYQGLDEFPCVAADNFGGGYMLARHLIGQKHSRIGGIFKSDDIQGPQRYQGTITALRDAGLTVSDQAFCWYDTEDRLYMMENREDGLIRRFLTSRLNQVSAVVCYNDEIAHLLIQQLIAMGKRVPEDMAVVSFDNSYFSQIGPVQITSLGHGEQRTGQVAAQQLLRHMEGSECRSVTLRWEPVIRESSLRKE